MNKINESQWTNIIPFLVFTGMGIFSYALLINHFDLELDSKPIVTWLYGAILAVALFNTLGWATIISSKWIIKQYTLYFSKQWSFIIHFALVGILLLGLICFSLIVIKYMLNHDNVFTIKRQGVVLVIGLWFAEMIIMSLMVTIYSLKNTLSLIKEKQELEEESIHARFIALQNQLNPHFLFNSLNTLIAEIDYDPEVAIQFTQNLSDVYRYTLQHQEFITVRLKDEIDFLKSFIFLHQVRLGKSLTIEYKFNEEDLEYKLPPLALQILAENVIKHNYISQSNEMFIEVTVDRSKNVLIFRNTLKPRKTDYESGKGLNNLRERYRLLCNKDIYIEQTDAHFIVTLPLIAS